MCEGEQTDQESRSEGERAAPSVTVMDITIDAGVRPHDRDACLAFYRAALGAEVCDDAGYGEMPLSSPKVKGLGLIWRTEVLRNG